ncbi:MAG: NAD(P)H-binding protein [Pseudomonadales bacterium]|nr:NAD(P)H-binding protein [Pseudomonadales bacterium]
MKIFITGATGLIGAHTTLELLAVRLLVRNPKAVEGYFSALGYNVDDLVVSDMQDKEAVNQSMIGCDAVVYIAAIVDSDARNAKVTESTHLKSIDSVVLSACELGIKKVLYILA